jgi:hypothetical protein
VCIFFIKIHIYPYIGGVNIDKQKRSTIRFPSLKIKKENLHRLDTREEQRENTNIHNMNIRIKDLSWSDKEVVLRVLFAKLNAGTGHQGSGRPQGTGAREGLFLCIFVFKE